MTAWRTPSGSSTGRCAVTPAPRDPRNGGEAGPRAPPEGDEGGDGGWLSGLLDEVKKWEIDSQQSLITLCLVFSVFLLLQLFSQ